MSIILRKKRKKFNGSVGRDPLKPSPTWANLFFHKSQSYSGQSYLGQVHFGQPLFKPIHKKVRVCVNASPGSRVLGSGFRVQGLEPFLATEFGQNRLWPKPTLAKPTLAKPSSTCVCLCVFVCVFVCLLRHFGGSHTASLGHALSFLTTTLPEAMRVGLLFGVAGRT